MYTPLTSEERDLLARAADLLSRTLGRGRAYYSAGAVRFLNDVLDYDAGHRPEIDSDIILGDEDLTLDDVPMYLVREWRGERIVANFGYIRARNPKHAIDQSDAFAKMQTTWPYTDGADNTGVRTDPENPCHFVDAYLCD